MRLKLQIHLNSVSAQLYIVFEHMTNKEAAMKLLKRLMFLSLFFCLPVLALLPPKYLSVPHWKNCVGAMTRGSAQFICLPEKRPHHCSRSSWKKLKRTGELQSCLLK